MFFRSLVLAFRRLGWKVTFIEQTHNWLGTYRDYSVPLGLTLRQYSDRASLITTLHDPQLLLNAALVLKFSGSSISNDRFLDEWLIAKRRSGDQEWLLVYVDADAPMRLPYILGHPHFYLRNILNSFDAVWVVIGGSRAVAEYQTLGARRAFYLPAALDSETLQPIKVVREEFAADLAFVGNPTLGRQKSLQRLFFDVASACRDMRFLLAGAEWDCLPALPNVTVLGYVPSQQLAALYRSARLMLNVTREEMALYGDAAALRLFEAAACGACIVTDAWRGLNELFLPDEEIIVVQDTDEVILTLRQIDWPQAREIGARAQLRMNTEHTTDRRIQDLFAILGL